LICWWVRSGGYGKGAGPRADDALRVYVRRRARTAAVAPQKTERSRLPSEVGKKKKSSRSRQRLSSGAPFRFSGGGLRLVTDGTALGGRDPGGKIKCSDADSKFRRPTGSPEGEQRRRSSAPRCTYFPATWDCSLSTADRDCRVRWGTSNNPGHRGSGRGRFALFLFVVVVIVTGYESDAGF